MHTAPLITDAPTVGFRPDNIADAPQRTVYAMTRTLRLLVDAGEVRADANKQQMAEALYTIGGFGLAEILEYIDEAIAGLSRVAS